MRGSFEPVIGRYMHLELFGKPHRIYVEEAGEGTPLLCLHTAGSDGRQYRALMNDPRVTDTILPSKIETSHEISPDCRRNVVVR